jgi:hypothetical protein
MAQFMLLLYDDPTGWQKLSPEEMQTAMVKYRDWTTKPFTTSFARLGEDTGKVLRSKNGKPVASDGPYSETKEVLGGYYTIEAADYDDAVRIASAHPHIEYGGTIEVRRLWGQ